MSYKEFALDVVRKAQKLGADHSEVYLQYGEEFKVNVRKGEIDTLTQAGSKGLGLRVLVGKKMGFAHTSDFSPKGIDDFVRNTINLAKEASYDEFNGLPEEEPKALPQLELFDPEREKLSIEQKIAIAQEMERAAFAYDNRINNSEGSGYSDFIGTTIIANSKGIVYSYSGTSFNISCAPVAEQRGEKQVSWWWSSKRFFSQLKSPKEIGREAAKRTIRMLGARKIKTQKVPVVFDIQAASSFWARIFDALNGDNVFKKASFLADKLGERVGSELVTVIDDGTLPKGLGSRPFDGEGVPTRGKVVIDKGVLKMFLYDTHTARKAGTQTTGNAVRGYSSTPRIGAMNFFLQAGDSSPEEIIASVENGFYVTRFMGFGANVVTGDYSLGASGLWIKGGEIAYPVQEVTIASNMLEMMKNIEMVGNDLEFMGPIASPTFKVAEMTVSGR